MLHSADPTVKSAKPILYSLTLPNISASLPKFKSTEAVTTQYPSAIQTKVRSEVCNDVAIVGNAITTIFLSSEAISVPMVVLLRAIHLYCKVYYTTLLFGSTTVQVAQRCLKIHSL